MSKRPVGSNKEAVEEQKKLAEQPIPEITFSEAEVNDVAQFVNWVYLNGRFEMTPKESKDMAQKFAKMHQHVSKIEQYIFEFRRVVNAKKAKE